ncbi:hypothetical protein Emag_006895 [Eimeria magna]
MFFVRWLFIFSVSSSVGLVLIRESNGSLFSLLFVCELADEYDVSSSDVMLGPVTTSKAATPPSPRGGAVRRGLLERANAGGRESLRERSCTPERYEEVEEISSSTML